MTKKEFFAKKQAIMQKHAGKVAELKEDYATRLMVIIIERDRINLTMSHRANLAKAEKEYQHELMELRMRDLAEAAEKEAAEREAKEREAKEREAKEREAAEKEAVWPDGTYWSAMVTARRLLSRVHPRHGDGVSVSILWTKESGWFVNAAHTDDNGGLTRMFCNTYKREEMEEFQREFAASVNAWHEKTLPPMAKAFDNALNAVFGERKGGKQ